jgi:hypothetical protein
VGITAEAAGGLDMTTPLPSRLRAAIGYTGIAALMPWPHPAAAQNVEREVASPITVVSREEIEQLPRGGDLLKILDLHNRVRSEVGSPPLRWNPDLARGAQEWADTIARTGVVEHSSRVGRENERENIVAGPFTPIGPLAMAQTWVDEQSLFRPGVFPDVCTGDWSLCAHYSQMVWSTTTEVGCGYAEGMYVALVCRYAPKGNIDGKLVIDLTAPPPTIAINNTVDPNAACQVPEPEDWVKLLAGAASQSGLAPGGSDPRDAATDRQWQLALEREQAVQDRLMTELATVQGDVGTHINAYLAATSAWQENYVYLASRTTTLQGQLTEWLEAKEVYERADLAFAVANLGVGGVKLGFKAYRFLTAPRAAAAGAETAAGATRVVAGAANEVADAGAAAGAETRIFNRTVIPPGQNPLAPGFPGFRGTTSTAGDIADVLRAKWQREVDMTRRLLDEAVANGDDVLAQANREALESLLRTGPATSAPVAKVITAADRVADLDPALVDAAREAGVAVENFATGVGTLEAQNLALMRAIAQARGWHDIPTRVGDAITNVLIQARKGLAGVDNAPINPQLLDDVRRLKAMADARGINFADWLRKAAGEISTESGQVIPGATEGVLGIVRYFDDADIDLLLKVIDTGGDLAALRKAVSPVTQASLNGLGRAGQAGGAGCGALDAGLALNGIGGTLQGAGAGPGQGSASGPPTDAQLENVLYGTGKLGEVGLGNAVDQFGVTDRFTAGQGLPRAIAGELWELVGSPSATVASHYFTHQAQGEYLDLLQTEGDRMVALGTRLTEASNALAALQNTLQRAGLSGPGSYLGTRGPADLRSALDNLDKVYRSGSGDWQRSHKAELDARRDHIAQKLAALAETVADLNALAARMAQMRNYLDSLRVNPDGGLRGPVDLFNPIVFVRLGSISLFLRGMGADAFGLSTGAPFQLSAPAPVPQPADTPAEDFDTMRARDAERLRALDEASEVEVDPDFEAWLNSIESQ